MLTDYYNNLSIQEIKLKLIKETLWKMIKYFIRSKIRFNKETSKTHKMFNKFIKN